MKKPKVIFLVDMQSFFASVERANHPQYERQPLVVSGDPARRSGVILAACPLAKKTGIKNGERLGEAKQKCSNLVVVSPHMQQYIDESLKITRILEGYTDQVEPYSIDEQFMDVTGSQRLFGSPRTIAKQVQADIFEKTKIRARVGIGENKVLAKLACDNFAKKRTSGIYRLSQDVIDLDLWHLPIEDLFGVGGRMCTHLRNMGIRTIGQLAKSDPGLIKKRFGRHGQVLWMSANGEDDSPVTRKAHEARKAYGNGMTLPRDYVTKEDLRVVLLELCEEVCQRTRKAGRMGSTVTLSVMGASYEEKKGFHRQYTMALATNITMEVYTHVCTLLDKFWEGYPVRKIAVSLSNLQSDQDWQLSLFEDNESRDRLAHIGYVMDEIRDRYGKGAITRGISLMEASQLKDRHQKIGGHYK
ncbi:DNA polymerase IV [Shouchella shacheensis]|uniref:DNA polymerase IV n=1 Tax=Shouchella shacheensis TaxID=1649580 RepID=UPI00073FAE6B|nr:DNA polymerase IV [Shouchella shacheensis]